MHTTCKLTLCDHQQLCNLRQHPATLQTSAEGPWKQAVSLCGTYPTRSLCHRCAHTQRHQPWVPAGVSNESSGFTMWRSGTAYVQMSHDNLSDLSGASRLGGGSRIGVSVRSCRQSVLPLQDSTPWRLHNVVAAEPCRCPSWNRSQESLACWRAHHYDQGVHLDEACRPSQLPGT